MIAWVARIMHFARGSITKRANCLMVRQFMRHVTAMLGVLVVTDHDVKTIVR